jgi:hypothetical protein
MKDIIADGAIIGMSAAFLWHFLNIWRYGQYLVGESNIVIRSLETAGLIAILGFGIGKYISDLKKKKRDRLR